MSERLRGYIRWFSHQKRYGRIQLGSGHPDIFVQIEDLQDIEDVRELEEGELVEFSIEQTPAGPIALHIVMLTSEQ
jgi:CspA family cold shock protein